MDVLWFVVLFLVVQFFHAFSNYGPSICIPPPKYHINSSANWHSLQAVRAGCLLFRRVLLSVRTPLSILTFWPAPKLITDASQSKDSVSQCYSQTFKALQFSMFCNINIVNMQVQQNPIKNKLPLCKTQIVSFGLILCLETYSTSSGKINKFTNDSSNFCKVIEFSNFRAI